MKSFITLVIAWALSNAATLIAGEPKFRVHEIGRPGGVNFGQTSIVDVDQDGDLDFISGRQRGDVFWFENQGAERWKQRLIGADARTDVGGVAFDVDGDGWIDQASGGTWFRNPGNPREATDWPRFENGAIVAHDNLAADLDGDGKLDLVSIQDKAGVFWYRIPRDPTARWTEHKLLGVTKPQCHGGIAVGDIDGDNDVSRVDRWLENADGKGGRWQEHVIQRGLRTHESVCGDVDGDGDIDILTKPWRGDVHLFVENLHRAR